MSPCRQEIYLRTNLDFKREDYERLGFWFGLPEDKMFKARLPEGWSVNGDGRIRSVIFDAKGRERAIFEDGKISLKKRYHLYHAGDRMVGYEVYLQDAIDATKVFVAGVCEEPHSKECKELEEEVRRYATEHFPDWQNPLAYWDEAA